MAKSSPAEGRRRFLKESATGVGAIALGATYVPASAFGASDRIRLGIVGTGSRGGALMSWAQKLSQSSNVQFTAACDLWNSRLVKAARRIEEWNGRPPAACRTPDELFSRSDVDAVIIATPDFQHCWLAAQAALAGKDVYVEKPFGCDFEQVRRARDLIAGTDRIVQVGTQSRGSGKYTAAARFVQAGKLGKVTYVEIAEPILQQRWRIPGSETALKAGEIDWKQFLCYLPGATPVDSRKFLEFRNFWPFSSGPLCQWMSHRIDLVNLVLGSLPVSATASGGIYLWNDGRNNPDTISCLFEYPGGVLVSYHLRMGNSQGGRGITIYGTGGTLELDKGLAYGDGGGTLVAEDSADGLPRCRIDARTELKLKRDGGYAIEPDESVDYLEHFFACVRSRTQPRGNVESGFGHSIATIIAHQSYRTGRKIAYDPSSREFHPAVNESA